MDIITQRFIAISNKLLAELRRLNRSVQELSRGVHDAKEAQNQQKEQEPPVLRAELQVPEAIEREAREDRKKQHRIQVWLTVGTWLAFIAAGIYARVAYKQWRTMNDTYGEIKTQTETLIQQTNLLRREMEGYQAAVVQMKMHLEPSGNGLFGQVVNFGHVMSPTVTFKLDIFKQRYSPNPSASHRIETFERQLTQFPPTIASPNEDVWERGEVVVVSRKITDDELATMTYERPTIIVKGTIVFDTGFDRKIATEECWVYIRFPPYPRKDGQMNAGGGNMQPCNQWDTVIFNYLETRKRTE